MSERFVPLTAAGEIIGAAGVDIEGGTIEMRVFDSYVGPVGTVIDMEQFSTSVRVVNGDAMEVALAPKVELVKAAQDAVEE